MRVLCLAVVAFALVFSVNVWADAGRPNLKNLDKPILLDDGVSKRMGVVFNHKSHKSVKCVTCHHEGLPGNRYASCTNSECHAITGPAERDPMSVYMAYHAPDTDRSCYGCHKSLAGKYPSFKGCQPCHRTPAQKLAVEAAAQK